MVTFLFTDIEGSTRLWEHDAASMSTALAAHDAMLRAAIEERGGVVFKTVGDAFCAAFVRPEDALGAAVDAQRRLAAHPWDQRIGTLRVRMGIHTGTAVETGGDYFGPTVNRVARVMSIGYGEQILVSGATAPLLRDVLPDGVTLSDVGTHRLKDLSRPEPTYQVQAPGLRSDFPALKSLETRPNNLPFEFSTFIGRSTELAVIGDALAQRRLVSIVGPGGIGKTRLAMQAAADAIDRFADGAWIVSLSPLHSGDLIAHAVAEALRVRESPQERMDETVARELAGREMLLVLDSAEHLVAATAAFVKTILSRCASVKVLVTSREPLHLTGEYVCRVGPLEMAEELLLDRAREVLGGDFVPGDAELQAVEAICARLECIPLAIELAAARLATMPLAELNVRLARTLNVLVSRDPTKEMRHRTLHATIAWSYDLLEARDAELLKALGVFRGAFDAAAVTAVAGTSEDDALDAIEALVDKSLVSLAAGGKTARYILSDTVRDFVVELLRAAGSLDVLSGRHFDYYAQLVSAQPLERGADSGRRLDEIAADISNLRAALDWGAAHRPLETAAMAIELARYWKIRGHLSEGRAWMRRLLENAVGGPPRAALLRRAATFATEQDDYDEARQLLLECRALYEAAGDASGVGEAIHALAVIEQRCGRLDEAEAYYDAAIAIFRDTGHDYGLAIALMNVALLAFDRNDLDKAERHIGEAADAASRTGIADVLGHVERLRGDLARRRERPDDAVRHYLDALALKRSLGNRYDIADVQDALAIVYLRQGRIAEARAAARETLRAALELDATSLAIFGFEAFAEIAAAEQRFDDAAQCFCFARALRRTHSYVPSARQLDEIERTVRLRIGDDDFERAARRCAAGDWRAAAAELIETA